MVAGLSDCPENRPLFDLLAQHSEADVRIAIARKRHLSPEVAGNLLAAEQMHAIGDLLIDNYRELESLFDHFQASQAPDLYWDAEQRVETGFAEFDRAMGGIGKGVLTVLCGAQGCGLTALALNIAAHNACKEAMTVMMFSTGLPAEQLSMRSGIPMHRLMRGDFDADGWRALAVASGVLAESSIEIAFAPRMTPQLIRSAALSRHRRPDLLIIDNLNDMNSASDALREQIFEEQGGALSSLAAELDIPMLALVEIEQQSEFPSLPDLRRFSKALTRTADSALMLYRNARFAELIVAKPLASAKASLMFDDATLSFTGIANR